MTTTSLKLSRQLQERWPEWKTSLWWNYDYTHDGKDYEWRVEGKMLRFEHQPVHPSVRAYDLDELRVFALELIGDPPLKYKTGGMFPDISEEYDLFHARRNALKDTLIQGCDPTAEWIIKTFGEK